MIVRCGLRLLNRRRPRRASWISTEPPRAWPDDVSPGLMSGEATKRPSAKQGLTILRQQIEHDEYLLGILEAQSKVYDVCRETDLQYAPGLSERLGNEIYLKREDQQPVFSFKIRGAYNKIATLTQAERDAGVVACSAGNHAQGVALSATKLGIDQVILMPIGTPSIKVDAVRRMGGNVRLFGENFDQAQAEALRLAEEEGRTLVHPFDDFEVICGQGTIALEISKQLAGRPVEAVFCCVGGGGLLAGVSAYMKRTSPQVKMIGVEARDAPGMTRSLAAGRIVELDQVGLFADGAAVRRVGRNTFALCRDLTDGMVTVSTDEICAAIKSGFKDTRTVFEPAGALGLAGLIKYVERTGVRGKTFVAVASGANMDFDRLRFVSERADSTEALISVRIPERPGSFWRLYMTIYPRNVTEFSYRMLPGTDATVFLSFQATSAESREEVVKELEAQDYIVTPVFVLSSSFVLCVSPYRALTNACSDLNRNEMAKVHGRHLAGGRSPDVSHERLFMFEFPERPGALHRFLSELSCDEGRSCDDGVHDHPAFNVSLFHYRNHGADIGRVLVGLQVPDGEESRLSTFLSGLGFHYTEETENPAYTQLLR